MAKIAIASDHGGYKLKEKIKEHFADFDWLDLGTDSDESVDYPEFGQALARAITNGEAEQGVLICGSGIGISIAANRFAAVRAALCTSEEMATLSRQHNNANVIALGERITDEATALKCVETFFNTNFEGGRHERRVGKLDQTT
ncbi:MAG: ribose 5-phosphate isomerase B [Pseudomonadota bacterium]